MNPGLRARGFAGRRAAVALLGGGRREVGAVGARGGRAGALERLEALVDLAEGHLSTARRRLSRAWRRSSRRSSRSSIRASFGGGPRGAGFGGNPPRRPWNHPVPHWCPFDLPGPPAARRCPWYRRAEAAAPRSGPPPPGNRRSSEAPDPRSGRDHGRRPPRWGTRRRVGCPGSDNGPFR